VAPTIGTIHALREGLNRPKRAPVKSASDSAMTNRRNAGHLRVESGYMSI
jgi:hypothetical protein